MKMKRHLRIVGVGYDERRLRSIASSSPYIHFVHIVSDKELHQLYEGAKALLCPQQEDFGLVSIEAQMHGTPVLSYVRSGVAETIIDGETGILFTHQTGASVITAMRKAEEKRWIRTNMRTHARTFGGPSFEKKFTTVLLKLWRKKGS